jgi:hypothetical protein
MAPPADQKRLGFTMRVERSTVDSVKERLAKLKETSAAAAAAAAGAGSRRSAVDEYQER